MVLITLEITVFNETYGLKASEVCLINPNVASPECLDGHKYRCTEQFCSANQIACTDFIAFNTHLSKLKSYKMKMNVKMLVKSIKVCARNRYVWNENDVCLNTFTCFKKNVINHHKSGMTISIRKQSFCTCPKMLNYECQSKYCSVDEIACQELSKQLANGTANKINKCKSINLIKLFVFENNNLNYFKLFFQ